MSCNKKVKKRTSFIQGFHPPQQTGFQGVRPPLLQKPPLVMAA